MAWWEFYKLFKHAFEERPACEAASARKTLLALASHNPKPFRTSARTVPISAAAKGPSVSVTATTSLTCPRLPTARAGTRNTNASAAWPRSKRRWTCSPTSLALPARRRSPPSSTAWSRSNGSNRIRRARTSPSTAGTSRRRTTPSAGHTTHVWSRPPTRSSIGLDDGSYFIATEDHRVSRCVTAPGPPLAR
jgi:hypothetical protein